MSGLVSAQLPCAPPGAIECGKVVICSRSIPPWYSFIKLFHVELQVFQLFLVFPFVASNTFGQQNIWPPDVFLLTHPKSSIQHFFHLRDTALSAADGSNVPGLDHGETRWVPCFIQDLPHDLQVCARIGAGVECLLELASDAFVQAEMIGNVLAATWIRGPLESRSTSY